MAVPKDDKNLQSALKREWRIRKGKSTFLLISLALIVKLLLASFLWIYLRHWLPLLALIGLAKIILVPLVVLFIMNNLQSMQTLATSKVQKKDADETMLLDPITDESDEFVQNPYPLFEKYRGLGNVVWSTRGNQWIVTGFEEANQILRHNNFGKKLEQWKNPNLAMRWFVRLLRTFNTGNMLFQDPPQHTRVRSLMQSAFVPSTVRSMEPKIQVITDGFLAGITTGARGDLLSQLAFPLPVTVIAELLGIPANDRDKFKEWSTQIVSSIRGNVCPYRAVKSFQASRELRAYLKQVVKDKSERPGDDLLTALVKVQAEDGSRLSEAELLSNSVLLLIAGHETTVNLIGNGIYHLLKNPAQKELLIKYPSLIDSAIEEILRFDPPVQMVRRIANKDTLIGTKLIKRGDVATILIGACNRDPAKFKDGHSFDIQREATRTLSFGGGIHYCLGAELARSEARIAISTVLKKYPDIKLQSEKPVYRSPFALRGFKELNVTYLVPIIVLCSIFTAALPASAQAPLKAEIKTEVNLSPPPSEANMLGEWKAHVFEVERRPTVIITECSEKQVQGIYQGQLGKFPLNGTYDATTGKVRLEVNFSRSGLLRLRGISSATAILEGQLNGKKMLGTATFPEFRDKQFRWEAAQSPPNTQQEASATGQ